jgi:nuclear transcription Y subunit beta
MSATPPKKDVEQEAEPSDKEEGDKTLMEGAQEQGGFDFEVKEQDRWLPIANGAFSFSPHARLPNILLRFCCDSRAAAEAAPAPAAPAPAARPAAGSHSQPNQPLPSCGYQRRAVRHLRKAMSKLGTLPYMSKNKSA